MITGGGSVWTSKFPKTPFSVPSTLIQRRMASLYKVQDKRRFLIAALQQLAGSAFVSFEGDLRGTALIEASGASGDETTALKRNTLWPKQDFVVLPLEAETVGSIMEAVGGTVPRSILHIQVEKEGRLELGLYDNFAPKAMFFGPALTPEVLENLQSDGILSHWTER